MLEYVERGIKDGAKLVLGGKQLDRPGLFFAPTIFTNVTDDMFIAQEESFGPIMIISKVIGEVCGCEVECVFSSFLATLTA